MATYRARVICRDCDAVLSDVTRAVPPSLDQSAVIEVAQRESLDAIIAEHQNCDLIEVKWEGTPDG